MKNCLPRSNKHLIGFLLAVAGLTYGLALPLNYFPGLPTSRANSGNAEARSASSAPRPNIPGPSISAVKSHSPAGPFRLGDTITYSTTVSNTGVANGTGVTFSDTPDANTSLVAGSIQASPVAVNDSYTATGNVSISVPAGSGVLTNDFLGLNPAATITAFDATSANGGTVAVAANGSFTYAPAPGFTGADTFTYTLSNPAGSCIGTVTITVSNMVWFINNAASAGDGRLQSPFNSLAAFAAVNDGVGRHPKSGDAIFIYQGTGSYPGPLTLLNNQRLTGQGDPLAPATLGFTPAPNSSAFPGATAKPTLTGTITLATGVTVLAIDLSTAGSNGIVGSGGLSGVTVGDSPSTSTNGVTVTTTTGTAVSLNNVGGTFTFRSISANGGANGISLISTTGSFAVTGDGATANSGGTIQHNTGANQTTAGTGSQGIGLYMSTAQNVALSWMHLHDFDNFAIQGTSVTNFTLDHTTIDGVNGNSLSITPNSSGQSSGEGSIQFYDLLGTSAFTNCTISGGKYDTVQIIQMTGSLSSLTVNNCTISQSDTTGNTGFAIFGPSNSVGSTINLTVTNSTFPRAHGNLLDVINNGTAAMSTTLTSNLFSDSDFTTAGGGVHVAQGGHSAGNSNLTFDIETNTFGGTAVNGFNSTCVTAALHLEKPVPTPLVSTTATGKIIGNQFGTTGHAGSSTSVGAGSDAFQIDDDGNGSFTVLVKNNNIHGFDENALSMFAEEGNTGLNATLIGNTMDTINGASPNNLAGLFVAVGAQGSDTNNSCLHIGQVLGGEVVADKNSINAAGASGGFVSDVILESFGTDLITLPSYAGPTNDSGGQVETYWTNANTLSDASQVTVAVNTPNFHNTTPGGTDCAQPPLRFAAGGVEAATTELRVATSGPSALQQEQLDSIVKAARQRWMTAGLTPSQVAVLDALQFEVSDLDQGHIGAAGEHVTLLDRKGAGHGWFVDANPLGNAAFSKVVSPSWLFADPDSPAAGHLDLLTAVMHEMGHRLGMGDKSAERNRGHIMYGELSVGERRLPIQNDWTLIQVHPLLSGEAAPDSETDDILRAVAGENADKDDAAQQPTLTSGDLSWIAQSAIARWQEAGISSEEVVRLQGVKLEIIDLPGDQLVMNTGTTGVQVDENAAGHGWFVDPSPQDDSKFTLPIFGREFQADLGSAPFGHMDLLTAIMHAFGRILGKNEEHATDVAQAWLMKSWLSTGTRRIPRADATNWNKSAQAAPKNSGVVARNSNKQSGNRTEAALKVEESSPRFQYVAYNRSGRQPALLPAVFHSAQPRNLAPVAAMLPAMFFTPPASPNVSIGTLPVGKSVIVGFQVTINNPLTSPANATSIVNTGQVSGTNFATVNTNTDTASLCVPPVVAAPLTNQQVAQGATATFTTTLTGDAPFTSVWKENGTTLVSGASLGGRATITNTTVGSSTTSTLTITGTIPSDATTYTVDSSDAAACGDIVPTQTATLTVVPPADTTAVSVSTNPATIILGQTITITAAVTDTTAGHTGMTPTGGVTFTDQVGSTVISLNGGNPVALNNLGQAILTGITLAGTGLHTITASYVGVSGTFMASTSFTTIQVAPLTTGFQVLATTLATGGLTLAPYNVAVDGSGNVYIVDDSNNQIVEVSPKGAVSPLTFPSLGGLSFPEAVAVDGSGNIYVADTANDRVVELSAGGVASVVSTASLLSSPDGLAVDAAGDLYIADNTNSYIVEVPAGGTAAQLTITGLSTALSGPASLAVDTLGNLYIADVINNRIVEVAPGGAGTARSITGLSTPLNRPQGVAVDEFGNIYIADRNNNRIVTVTPAGVGAVLSTGTDTLSFPQGVAVGVFGTVYIADSGNARIVEVQPSAIGFGHSAVGATSGTTLSLPFSVGAASTVGSVQAFTLGTAGLDFTVVAAGTTCVAGTTDVLSCSVNVRFLPTAAGLRRGEVVLFDQSMPPVPIASVSLYGTGDAPLATLSPGIASVINTGSVTTLNPFQIALDGGGNMYVGNHAGGNVVKVPAGGGSATVVNTGGLTLTDVTGVVLDGAGNLYIADHALNRIVEVTASGVASVLNISGLSPGLNQPLELAMDGAGNLYIADSQNNRVVIVTPQGVGSVFSTGSYVLSGQGVAGVAVDGSGTVYVADRTNSNVVKVTAAGAESLVVPNGITPVLAGPQGVSVDGMGNLYIADSGNNRIVEVTSAGNASVVQTPGLTLGAAGGMTPDTLGNIFIPDWNNNRLVKVMVTGAALSFLNTNVGSTSTPLTATVTNIGDLPLVFSTNPTYPADFSQPSGSSDQCLIATSLAPGTVCDVSVEFTPLSATLLNESIALTNNNLNATNTTQGVAASGTGVPGPGDATAVAVSTNPTAANLGQPLTLTAIVTDTTTGHTTTFPTGGVNFVDTVGSTSITLNNTVPVTLNSVGQAILSGVTLSGVGTHTITANYAGVTGTFTPSSNITTLTVSQDTAVIAGPATQPVLVVSGQASSVLFTATGPYPVSVVPAPTGTVTHLIFNSSGGVVTTGTLTLTVGSTNSTVTVPIPNTLANGNYTVSAGYNGDTNYVGNLPATVVPLIVGPAGPIVPTINWTPPVGISYGATLGGILNATAVSGSTAVAGTFTYTATLAGGSAVAVIPTTVLGAGSYALTATFTPTNTTAFASATANVSLTVAKATPAVALASSAASVGVGSPVTFTATISSAAGTPSGSVTFYSGTTSLGSGTLALGVATYTTTNLPVGALSITAVYSGDSNFSTLTSSALTESVMTTFTVTAPTTPVTIGPGGSVSVNLSVPPLGGAFDSVVTLSATGLPPGATATFNPPTVTPGTAGATTVMTIQLGATTASIPARDTPGNHRGFPAVPFSLGCVLFGAMLGRKRIPRQLVLALALAAAGSTTLLLSSCGTSHSTPPQTPAGNYTVKITGTSGTLQESTTMTLVVQ